MLQKLGRGTDAVAVIQKALPFGNMNEIHQYARQLMGMKLNKMAFDIFKANFDKYPNQFTTLMGMMRGYAGINDLKNALKYATLALPLSPNQQNKTVVEGLIQKLKDGKDIN